MQFMRITQAIAFAAALLAAGAAPASAAEPVPCAEKSVSAAGVRSTEDVEAFVQCAYEYVQEMGFEEARRAFHEDARWKSGQFYIFITNPAADGDHARTPFVFGADPTRAGMPWGDLTDGFGTDLLDEWNRTLALTDRAWVYYGFRNPADALVEPKATYLIRLDWEGNPAVIGSGIYRHDFPGACPAELVNAAALDDAQSMAMLEEFVRCAALEVESKGYFGTLLLETSSRWRAGSIYLFGMDMSGNQLFSGSPVMIGGERAAEWGGDPKATFLGRDMVDVADTFGESYIYYHAPHPATGVMGRKAAFVKRVSAQGAPLLVGAGIYLTD